MGLISMAWSVGNRKIAVTGEKAQLMKDAMSYHTFVKERNILWLRTNRIDSSNDFEVAPSLILRNVVYTSAGLQFLKIKLPTKCLCTFPCGSRNINLSKTR